MQQPQNTSPPPQQQFPPHRDEITIAAAAAVAVAVLLIGLYRIGKSRGNKVPRLRLLGVWAERALRMLLELFPTLTRWAWAVYKAADQAKDIVAPFTKEKQ